MKKIWEQINHDNWMKGWLFEGFAGAPIHNQEGLQQQCQAAQKCCLVGWTVRVYGAGIEKDLILEKIRMALQASGEFYFITEFNDNPATTVDDVRNLCKVLDI